MKKFFGEFKKFITRGNVLDMSVGVIVGGAFTGIVNGLSNFILKPIINWLLALIFGSNSLSGILTFLRFVPSADNPAIADLTQIVNMVREGNTKFNEEIKKHTLDRNERKELKAAGVKISDKAAVKAYFAEKDAKAAAAAEEEKRLAEEQAKADRLANPTTEDLLKDIKALLEKSINK